MKYKTIHLFIAHCHSRCLISELCSESIFENVQTRKMAPSARLLSPFKYQVIEMFMNTGWAILLHWVMEWFNYMGFIFKSILCQEKEQFKYIYRIFGFQTSNRTKYLNLSLFHCVSFTIVYACLHSYADSKLEEKAGTWWYFGKYYSTLFA